MKSASHVCCHVLAFLLAAAAAPLFGQTPALLNYQGRLTDGTNLVNGAVSMELRLYNSSGGGTLLYSDSNSVTVVDGLYSTYIGDDTVFGQFDTALTNAQVWLEIRINGVALTPRERFTSVPYARTVEGLLLITGNTTILNPINGKHVVNPLAQHGAIGGGRGHGIGDVWRGTIAGGESNTLSSYSDYSVIGGGRFNTILNGSVNAAIIGGTSNTVLSDGDYAAVLGGRDNEVGTYALAAGRRAKAIHQGSFVWGDSTDADVTSATSNQVTFRASGGFRILGGAISGDGSGLSNFPPSVVHNFATNNGAQAFSTNNSATSSFATVGGGYKNTASGPGTTIGGGLLNTARGIGATVAGGGGLDTMLFMSVSNMALGDFSFVGGGGNNSATGRYSSVLGGKDNVAGGAGSAVLSGAGNQALGTYSVAAGLRAHALHTGTFVWADSQSADFDSTASDQFLVRASGGVGIFTNVPRAMLHVTGNAAIGAGLPNAGPNNGANVLNLLVGINAAGQSNGITFHEAGTGYGMKLGYDGTGTGTLNALRIYDDANTPLVTFQNGGNVGIGVTDVAALLHVSSGTAGDAKLLIEADTDNNNESDQPMLELTQDGGLVRASFGFDHASNDLNIALAYTNTTGSMVFLSGVLSNVQERMRINAAGNVGIGTSTLAAGYKLSVGGSIRCEEVVVESGWADYVFAPGYELPSLTDVERSIREQQRLPGLPSAAEVQRDGIGLSAAQSLLLRKVEELTLYILQQQRELEALRRELGDLREERRHD